MRRHTSAEHARRWGAQGAAVALVALSACAAPGYEWARGTHPCETLGVADEACLPRDERAPLHVSVCVAGAGHELSHGNDLLRVHCPMLPGLVHDCSSGQCDPLFFGPDLAHQAIAALLADLDGEGVARDDVVVGVVAHSWGGVSVLSMAETLVDDDRVPAGGGRVDRMVLIDPYAPFAPEPLEVPEAVKSIWSYRHSTPNFEDCSSRVPTGPFTGLPIACRGQMPCEDFDISSPSDPGGHCRLVEEHLPDALYNLQTGKTGPWWAEAAPE